MNSETIIKMMKKNVLKTIALSLLVLTFASCDDLFDKNKKGNEITVKEPTELFVLSEGLFNNNNSALAKYNLETGAMSGDFFAAVNNRGLGDTANDMGLYGSKLYVVVNVSGCVEVIDANTGNSLKQIKIVNSQNTSREPRAITFSGNKAYVCNFDGTIVRIDTTSLEIDATLTCGNNPDGICAANGKLYVSNSGGLNFPVFDNTVSVIDLVSFTEIKKITTGTNPGDIRADSEGNIFLVARGNYSTEPSRLQKISKSNDAITNFDTIPCAGFAINNDTAYIYNYDWNTFSCTVVSFNCKTDKVINKNFIADNTNILSPNGIDVNPFNSDVYITDAKNYTTSGDVFCFDKEGKLKFKLNETGINPNKVVFR